MCITDNSIQMYRKAAVKTSNINSRVIIWTRLVDLLSSMLYTKIKF